MFGKDQKWCVCVCVCMVSLSYLFVYAVYGHSLPTYTLLTPLTLSHTLTLEEDGHASRDSFGMQLFRNLLEPLHTARR